MNVTAQIETFLHIEKEHIMSMKICEAFEVENTVITKMPSRFEPNKVYLTNDKAFMKTIANEMLNRNVTSKMLCL